VRKCGTVILFVVHHADDLKRDGCRAAPELGINTSHRVKRIIPAADRSQEHEDGGEGGSRVSSRRDRTNPHCVTFVSPICIIQCK